MAEAPKIPQIVRERLRVHAEVPVGAEHPDADILTAFAENMLAARERSQVMNHLAACSSCREIVVLSQPATVETGEAAKVPASPVRNWMAFRWAALAACLVLTVGVVLLERSSRLGPAAHVAPPSPPPAPVAAPTSPDVQARMEAESATAIPAPRNEKPADIQLPREKRERAERAQRGLEAYGYADMKANSIGRPYDGARNDGGKGAIGRLDRDALTVNEQDSVRADAGTPAPFYKQGEAQPASRPSGTGGGVLGGLVAKAQPNAPSAANGNSSYASANGVAATTDFFASRQPAETSHRAAQEPGKKKIADETLPLTTASTRRVLPRDDKAAVAQSLAMSAHASSNFKFEAKDQPETLTASAEKLATASPTPMQWRIRGGKLQQSDDEGKTWQEVAIPPGISLRAFWSLGDNVWAGGTAGSLFRITDAGKNSVRIPIKVGEGDISQTVVAVTFSDELHGIITLENGQILQTSDGGKTWERH